MAGEAAPTRPKPFNLSYNDPHNRERVQLRREEIEREKMVECTFHARTAGALNKAAIERLVDEGG